MRFFLGVLVGCAVRGKQKLLIAVLVTLVVYVVLLAVVLPAIALLCWLSFCRQLRSWR
jgi:hypothetical protein